MLINDEENKTVVISGKDSQYLAMFLVCLLFAFLSREGFLSGSLMLLLWKINHTDIWCKNFAGSKGSPFKHPEVTQARV